VESSTPSSRVSPGSSLVGRSYAISVPMRKQMAIDSVAARAEAYGFPGVSVDGTDPEASYEVLSAAIERARAGGGPTLVEALIERIFPHTTDDDQRKYRTAEEIKRARDRDPVPALETKLRQRGVLDDAAHARIWADAKRAVNEANEEADQTPYPDPSGMFANLYGTEFPAAGGPQEASAAAFPKEADMRESPHKGDAGDGGQFRRVAAA